MKSTIYKVLGSSVLTFLIFSNYSFGQSGDQSTTPEIAKAREIVNKLLDDSGRSFRAGLKAFKANKRSDAGEKFDKSVETFLYSAINIQKDGKLQGCYNQLIETVYRLEFPAGSQAPRIRELSATCGWNWNGEDFEVADDVVAMVKPSATPQTSGSTAA